MSDFDAEAERKRLREKYEAEAESRKQTQQMSELLLKGATMTNRHCGECGSPIFQYEDQEFCPSCQRTVGAGAAEDGPESAPAATGDDAGGSDGPTDTDTTEVAAGSDSGESMSEARGSAPETGAGSAPETPNPDDTAPTPRAARESLLAALTRHARRAADTDEPRRATDHLEAARTAAAALDELDGA